MKYEYFFYKGFFSPDECKIISHTMQTTESDGTDEPADNVEKTAKVNVVNWPSVKHLLWRMEDAGDYINQRVFGFDLYKLTTQDYANHNIYSSDVQGKYDWHRDGMMDEIFDIKLTVIANISSKSYTGGTFELFLNGPREIEELNEPGSLLIFPSYIYHRVTPVTSGERETVSLWLHGPNFR
jgi:PKHD-type hydroxylase